MYSRRYKISVVIPFFKRVDWLEEAVESVLQQTYNNFEIIVINDGSNENMDSFLKKYGRQIIYLYKNNGGPALARNKGIQIATGEYIAFLDSDDLWSFNKLEIQLRYMLDHDLIWSHTSYTLFYEGYDKKVKTTDVSYFSGDVFLRCLISSPIATPCVMVKRDFLINNPDIRFSEEMRYGQDGFMWLNLARYQHLGAIPNELSQVRMRGKNAALRSRVYLKVKSQIWEFIKKKTLEDKIYKSISKKIIFAYWLCYKGDKFISLLEKKNWIKVRSAENLSRIIYSPSYLLLKSISIK